MGCGTSRTTARGCAEGLPTLRSLRLYTAMRDPIGEIRRVMPFHVPEARVCSGPCEGCSMKLLGFLESELEQWEQRLDEGEIPGLARLSRLAKTGAVSVKSLGLIGRFAWNGGVKPSSTLVAPPTLSTSKKVPALGRLTAICWQVPAPPPVVPGGQHQPELLPVGWRNQSGAGRVASCRWLGGRPSGAGEVLQGREGCDARSTGWHDQCRPSRAQLPNRFRVTLLCARFGW